MQIYLHITIKFLNFTSQTFVTLSIKTYFSFNFFLNFSVMNFLFLFIIFSMYFFLAKTSNRMDEAWDSGCFRYDRLFKSKLFICKSIQLLTLWFSFSINVNEQEECLPFWNSKCDSKHSYLPSAVRQNWRQLANVKLTITHFMDKTKVFWKIWSLLLKRYLCVLNLSLVFCILFFD